jgi:MFS transporter, DHA3 family, macrolide efflux protein
MKNFYILLTGQLISSIGSGLTDFGLALYVLIKTESVTATGFVAICAFLPSVLFSPIGGILADRYDRRLMMVIGEFLSGIALIICLIGLSADNGSLLLICIGVALSSFFRALTEPAFKATISDLLTPEKYAKAGGLVQLSSSAKILISPVLAGLLLQVTEVGFLILIDIFTFITTVVVILIVKKEIPSNSNDKREKDDFLNEMKKGINVVVNNKGILSIIFIMTFAVFSLGFVQILLRPLILSFSNEVALGFLTTFSAFGMLVGSLLISSIGNKIPLVKMLSLGLLGCGVFLAMMGFKENIYWIAIAGFLMFSFMPAIQVGAEVLLRNNIDNKVQGRAFGLVGFITQGGYILAYLFSGILADYYFEPLMTGNSYLAKVVGSIIGSGQGRGSALLIIIAGFLLILVGIITGSRESIKNLEKIQTTYYYEEVIKVN